MYRIGIIKGDGIGPEVVDSAVSILQEVLDFEAVPMEAGYGAYKKHGTPLPDETLETIKTLDSTLLGAVTTPPNIENYKSPVVQLRQELDLFANLRPVKGENIDLLIVRENTEGLYSGIERIEEKDGDIVAETVRRITKSGSERIARFGYETAKKYGRKKVTIIHKANIMRETCGLFLRTCYEVAKDYPEIETEDQIVDSMAMRLVTKTDQYDVLLATNMFGDILSDLAAGLAGGLGTLPSGNIGKKYSVFEPVHGSAPHMVGTGRPNPVACIRATAMMLDHLGEIKLGNALNDATVGISHQNLEQTTKSVLETLKKTM